MFSPPINLALMASTMNFVDYHFALVLLRFCLPVSWQEALLGEILPFYKDFRLKANI